MTHEQKQEFDSWWREKGRFEFINLDLSKHVLDNAKLVAKRVWELQISEIEELNADIEELKNAVDDLKKELARYKVPHLPKDQ